MSLHGRPKGEYRKAQPEGFQVSLHGRPKGEYRKAQPEGARLSGRPGLRVPRLVVAALIGLNLNIAPAPSAAAEPMPLPAPKSIVDLQPARRSESVALRDSGGRVGSATLTQLNPAVNAWFVLTLQAPQASGPARLHLENADPAAQQVALDATRPGSLSLTTGGVASACVLWPGNALEQARRSRLAYAPLCGGRLYLRNAVPGNRTTLEATTQFLRDHVWRGEQIVGFVRREFFRDVFVEHGHPASAATPSSGAAAVAREGAAPPAARLREPGPRAIVAEGLGIATEGGGAALVPGQWVRAEGVGDVYVSVAQPGALAVASATTGTVRPPGLDAVESDALVFLVAFDLAAFELGFALGNEHPRLGWSERVPEALRDPGLAGPDGIDSADPLVRLGMLSPALQPRTVATFTGGFKREHGAFRVGALAAVNQGSHYGFIEQGVVFSRLVPGLSTLYVLNDGTVGMKTWREQDAPMLARMRHARQNGVPLVERGPPGGAPVAGALVDRWSQGNWSGSADEKLRTLRAGACLVEQGGRRFLLYGYFSTATPRAMAHVFLSYGCAYAMHLDMNALEHTYMALYSRRGAHIAVEHLADGMAVLDKSAGGGVLPRFLSFADNRDFFYLLHRERTR
jgi:hypothetical protein